MKTPFHLWPAPARRGGRFTLLTAAFACAAGLLHAQSFNVGSDGTLGDVVIATNTTVDLPANGRLHYKSLTVNAGVTLSFNRNLRNTPVFILSQGDVEVNGTIDVSGGGRTANSGGRGGPGGFDGGKPGFGVELPPGAGYGPGGGRPGNNDCSGVIGVASGGSYGELGFSSTNGIYGDKFLLTLVGGSGGGGGGGNSFQGGGGGGGAILIAANTRISVNGTILARGAFGGACNNGGSGGAIRLVAFRVAGSGTLNAEGGNTASRGFGAGGLGRIRVDTLERDSLNFRSDGVFSAGGNLISLPPTAPRLATIEAAGNVIPEGSAPPTFVLPFGSSPARTIKVQARDFGRNVPIRVTLTPDSGNPVVVDAEVDNTTTNPAVVEVPVTLPVNTLVTVHAWTR
jgi:hypothetical protein